MRVLFATSEIYPYVKTGGLGDVAGALPAALAEAGCDVRLLLPGFPAILAALQDAETVISFPVYFDAPDVRILRGIMPDGVTAYVLDAPHFFQRGGIYVDANGQDYADNHFRFAAFCRAAVDLAGFDPSWQAEVIHGHDWQCGLIPAYLRLRPGNKVRSVLTIHNIAYQGLFPDWVTPMVGIPWDMFNPQGVEFYGKIGFLKAGLAYADIITTVSPSYAQEIQNSDQGCGLEGFLQSKAGQIAGILNGIDDTLWNPKSDPALDTNYDAGSLSKRPQNKRALQREFGLPETDAPLFGVVSRLGYHKGFDLLLESLPRLIEQGGQLVLLGSGEREMEEGFRDFSARFGDQVGVHIGYNETLAHRMQAGADVILMPSRSEPCGLVQMYAMRYGALPLVRKTGGLADTVLDAHYPTGTGFVFADPTAEALSTAIDNVFETWRSPDRWRSVQRNAMDLNFSWRRAAQHYYSLYKNIS